MLRSNRENDPLANLPRSLARVLAAIGWLHPVWMIGSLYLTWLIAWRMLGHMPRPSLDDPKHSSDWLLVPYNMHALAIITFPSAAILGAIGTVWLGIEKAWSKTASGLIGMTYVGLWIGLIGWFLADSGGVGEWFMD